MIKRIILIGFLLLLSGCKITGSMECRWDDPATNLHTVSRIEVSKDM